MTMTNREMFNALSNEDLVSFIDMWRCPPTLSCENKLKFFHSKCPKCWLKWLNGAKKK